MTRIKNHTVVNHLESLDSVPREENIDVGGEILLGVEDDGFVGGGGEVEEEGEEDISTPYFFKFQKSLTQIKKPIKTPPSFPCHSTSTFPTTTSAISSIPTAPSLLPPPLIIPLHYEQ